MALTAFSADMSSSEDSGRVSPSPSTVTLQSVYTLQEGDHFIKRPEFTGDTSDYDSTDSIQANTSSVTKSKGWIYHIFYIILFHRVV